MRLGLDVVVSGEGQLEVSQEARARVRPGEWLRLRAGDDGQPKAGRQPGEQLGDARDDDLRLVDQVEIVAIAYRPQRLDPRRRHPARFGQVPDPHPLAQQTLDVRRLVEHGSDGGQRVAVGAEVELLGVDEHAVVVEQDRVEHQG